MRYASPGHIVFSGAAPALRTVASLLRDLLDVKNWKAERRAEVNEKRIEAGRAFLKLVEEARAVGLTDEERQVLLTKILELEERQVSGIAEGRVTDVRMLEE